jgi:hypothetical protein
MSETSGTSGTYGRCKNLILNGTPLLGRKSEDIVKMDVKEISCEAMYWIHLAQDRLMAVRVKMVIKIWLHERMENSGAAE